MMPASAAFISLLLHNWARFLLHVIRYTAYVASSLYRVCRRLFTPRVSQARYNPCGADYLQRVCC